MAHDDKSRTLAERFKWLDNRRECKTNRAREHAKLVIPGLMPDSGLATEEELPVPYSSLPAEGTLALASRMVSVLYPLNNIPFFESQINDPLIPEGEDVTEENKLLGRFTNSVMDQLSPTNLRSILFLMEQHLIVIGDCLIFERNNYDFQLFRLDQYVVRRSPDGAWRELIIEEWVDQEYLPDEVKDFPEPKKGVNDLEVGPPDRHFEAIYTQVKWNNETKVWDVKKEFRTKMFDTGTFFRVSPYFPMRWEALAGEDYGRSLIESAFGDIRILDALRKALMDGSLMNSEFRWGVNPSGLTELHDFDNSVNGQAIAAVPGDIFPIQAENQAQVAITLNAVLELESRLGRRFLMNSVVQPRGERVTARQVSIIAQELEQALGGVLSLQTRDIQIPIARRTMFQMAADELLPPDLADFLGDGQQNILKISVKAGLEVLRREVENEKLGIIADSLRNLPEAAQRVFKWNRWVDKWISSFGIETVGLIKSDEELAAEDEQALAQQQAFSAQQAAQNAAVEATKQKSAQTEEVTT